MKTNIKSIISMAAIVCLAVTTVAFAHGGWGYRSHMSHYGGHMMGPEYDGGHMMRWGADEGSYRRGYGAWGNLSDEDAARLVASREKFYKYTRELRDRIEENEIALRKEMDQANPDQDKVFDLQEEISSLRGDFDEQALAHQFEVRKLLPENYRGSGYDYSRGYCW